MAGKRAAASSWLRRARVGFKRWAYSGLRRDRWQQPERVLAELGLRPGDRVADVGAGGGYFTLRLARAVGPSGVVYAVDTDTEMAGAVADDAAAEGWANVTAVEAREADAGLPERVDLAFLANAYHHLPDPERYFRGFRRHLRDGGRVAVLEVRPVGLYRLLGHATAPETVRSTLGAAGYSVETEHEFLPRQSFLIFSVAAAE